MGIKVMNNHVKKIALISAVALILPACATKNFGTAPVAQKVEVADMDCKQIESETQKLAEYRESVNEKSQGGQVKQMLWGGMWSVMADDKREAVARDNIKQYETLLTDAKKSKGCSF